MSFLIVDEQKCRRCGVCVAECPAHLIYLDGYEGHLPKLRYRGEQDCILCGHCVASCPFSALGLEPLPSEGFLPLDRSLNLSSFEQGEQFLKSRRSIRNYKKDPVPSEALDKIMDIARFAPTASHRQPVRWLLVEDSAAVRHLAELVIEWMTSERKNNSEMSRQYRMAGLIAGWRRGRDLILCGAPHLAVAYTDQPVYWESVDSAIALTYLELAAHAAGVGACWAGFFTRAAKFYPPIKAFLGLPQDAAIQGAQMLGYAAYSYPRLPWRKPLDLRKI
ncbi:MAG: nitroreductase family protein [Desulfovibrionaceae bacterium]|nr:nitroreductase family protein [Desulfovibrionaceae bacterium]